MDRLDEWVLLLAMLYGCRKYSGRMMRSTQLGGPHGCVSIFATSFGSSRNSLVGEIYALCTQGREFASAITSREYDMPLVVEGSRA
jgi:hypothetical protein